MKKVDELPKAEMCPECGDPKAATAGFCDRCADILRVMREHTQAA